MHLQTALVLEPAAVAVPTAGPPLVIGVDSSLTCTGIAGDGWADALRCKGKGTTGCGGCARRSASAPASRTWW